MAIRIPLVQINGKFVELQKDDKLPTEIIQEFVFEQTTPSSLWVIGHNMNKNPSVSTVLDDGSEVFGLKVYNSANQITISFSRPITGKAFLN